MRDTDGDDAERATLPRRAVLLTAAASAVGLIACRETPSGGASASAGAGAGAISAATFAEAEKIALVANTPVARALLVADAGALHERVRALRD